MSYSVAFTNCYAITINIQDEDWKKFDAEDPENGWSRITIYFSSRDAIRRYFTGVFMYGANEYTHEIDHAIRKKLFGNILITMTPVNAALLLKEQEAFINDIVGLGIDHTYTLNPHVNLFLFNLFIQN